MFYAPAYFKHDLRIYYRRIDANDVCEQAMILRKCKFYDGVYSMLYIVHGECNIFYKGRRYNANADSLMLIDMKQRINLEFAADHFCEFLFIQIHPSLIQTTEDTRFLRPFSDAYQNAEPILNLKNGSPQLQTSLYSLQSIILAVKLSLAREHILPRIHSVISDMCIYYDQKYFPQTLETDSIAVKVMDFIHKHCFENTTYQIISNHYYISDWKINEIVRSYTGMSLKQYLIKIRLDEAVHLLEHTNFSLNTIAKMCGFNSYTAFFRTYKKTFGDSPVRRKNQKQENS